MLKELLEKRDTAYQAYEDFIAPLIERDAPLTDEESTKKTELRSKCDQLEERIEEVRTDEARSSKLAEARSQAGIEATDAQVVSEPMTYGPGSPHSYYHDLARRAVPGCNTHLGAIERLNRHAFEMAREARLGTPLGKRAEHQMRDGAARSENATEHRQAMEAFRAMGAAEQRTALTTGGGATASASGGSAAAMVAPFVIGDYRPYVEPARPFADSLNRHPLPEYGMNLYLPAVTGPAGVASQTEGSGVQETDPSFGYISSAVITEAGQVTVSQQVLDRAGPGFEVDQVIADQLMRDLAPKIDTYAITQSLSGAGTLVDNSNSWAITKTSSTGGIYGKLSQAKAAIRTAAGTFANPNVAFMTPGRWEEIAGAADANGRPLVVPVARGVYNAAASGPGEGDAGVQGATSFNMNGLDIFADYSIPAPASGNDQVIVADAQLIDLYESVPVHRAVPQTLANNLQVLIQLYEYLTVLVRYPLAVQALSGTFFAAYSYS